MKHISSLDGLRGTAVLMVVFFHFFPRQGTGVFAIPASFGWMGVDIFFVLSGFLITSILDQQRGADHYYRNFYVRRLLRLAPLYYFLFLLMLVLTPWLHIHWQPSHLLLAFYCANYVLPLNSEVAKMGPFQGFHFWSLSVEEQFYLIWPWIVGSRLSRQTLRWICVAGIILAPLVRLALLHARVSPAWAYTSLPTRMDSLLMGALLALIPRPSLRTARWTTVFSVLSLGIVVRAGHSAFFQSRPMQGVGYSVLAVLAASILTLSLYPTTMAYRIFSTKILRFYGKYSYGLYLWHYLFLKQYDAFRIWVERKIPSVPLAGIVSFTIMLLVSTLIAVLSYRFIEQPFLRRKLAFSSERPISVRERQEARRSETTKPELQTAPSFD
jgi:peptidoglycan/LPS O-acetylase OafA/YrhL